MNLVAISGSPRGAKGNTAVLLDALAESARSAGASVTVFSLHDMTVQPCCGCEQCHRVGACPMKDDFPRIKAAVDDASGIVLASGNYMCSVTAQLKALIDRLSGPVHCQALTGKYAAAVVTSGSGQSKEVEDYILRVLRLTGCYTVGGVAASAFELMTAETRAKRIAAAEQLGENLVESIAQRVAYPEQDASRAAFTDRMKQLVFSRKDDWRYEYDYWQSAELL